MVRLDDYLSNDEVAAAVRRALVEDLGPGDRDVSSACFIAAGATGTAVFAARRAGRLAGAAMLATMARVCDPALSVALRAQDGAELSAGQVIGELSGPVRSIMKLERTALNFLTHLSGVATLTAGYVAAVAGTGARIYDTRKTLPGLRRLQKYAVACGGGCNHRMGLFDAVLIKDNHLAGAGGGGGGGGGDLSAAVSRAIAAARAQRPAPKFVEIEVDTLAQLEAVLPCGPDVVLLDNMDVEALGQAVAMRGRLAPRVQLEASGGVTLTSVGAIAATGVDRIAVGALTHSAPALDIGLDMA